MVNAEGCPGENTMTQKRTALGLLTVSLVALTILGMGMTMAQESDTETTPVADDVQDGECICDGMGPKGQGRMGPPLDENGTIVDGPLQGMTPEDAHTYVDNLSEEDRAAFDEEMQAFHEDKRAEMHEQRGECDREGTGPKGGHPGGPRGGPRGGHGGPGPHGGMHRGMPPAEPSVEEVPEPAPEALE